MAKSSSVSKSNRSGGPRTDEGKKIASGNSLKTGAYSNTLILPGEDESQFRQIEEQFIRDFQPADMAEIAMVRDLAVLAWKKIRLENLELRFTLERLNAQLGYFDKNETKFLSSSRVESNLHQIHIYTSELKRSTELARDHIGYIRGKGATVQDIENFENKYPLLHKVLVKQIDSFGFKNPTAKNILSYEYETDSGKTELFWNYFMQVAVNELEEIIWFCKNQSQIKQELQAVKDKRLMELMQNEKPSRAFDDLRRNFYRTLSELRKHQEWKRKMQVVDVTSRNVVDSGEEGTSD